MGDTLEGIARPVNMKNELRETKEELRQLRLAVEILTLELRASRADQPAKASKASRKDREDFAITMLLTNGPDASSIAEAIGVPRTTLLGWKRFRAAYNVAKAPVGTISRGFRRDGDLEAIADDAD